MRILVVDIDSVTRWVITRSLKEHVVVESTSLEEARLLLTNSSFDMVLLARNLPDGDGFTLLDEFEENNFCILTVNPAIDGVQQAISKGALGFLRKPIDIKQLRFTIQELEDRQKKTKSYTDFALVGSLVNKASKIRSIINERMPFLIYGEKGAGKTSLVKYLLTSENLTFVKLKGPQSSLEAIVKAFQRKVAYVVLDDFHENCTCFQNNLVKSLLIGELPHRIVFIMEGDPLGLIQKGRF